MEDQACGIQRRRYFAVCFTHASARSGRITHSLYRWSSTGRVCREPKNHGVQWIYRSIWPDQCAGRKNQKREPGSAPCRISEWWHLRCGVHLWIISFWRGAIPHCTVCSWQSETGIARCAANRLVHKRLLWWNEYRSVYCSGRRLWDFIRRSEHRSISLSELWAEAEWLSAQLYPWFAG